MRKVVRLTESDLIRIVKRVISEQTSCDDEFSKIEQHLEDDYLANRGFFKRLPFNTDFTGEEMFKFVCVKDHLGYIKSVIPTINNEKLKCVQSRMLDFCKSEGYTTPSKIS